MKHVYTSTALALLFGLGVAISGSPANAAGEQKTGATEQTAQGAGQTGPVTTGQTGTEAQTGATGQAGETTAGQAGQTGTTMTGQTGAAGAGETAAGAGDYITQEDAGTRAEARFDELAGGQENLSEDQLAEAMPGVEDVSALFQEIDEDGDGQVSRDEWRQWSDSVFAEATGPEGVTTEQYEEFERSGRFGEGEGAMGTGGGATTGGATGAAGGTGGAQPGGAGGTSQ